MQLGDLVGLAQEALLLSIAVSLPVIAVAGLVSLLMALFQAATQVHDITIAHLPRFVAAVIALALAGPWMGAQLSAFAARVFGSG